MMVLFGLTAVPECMNTFEKWLERLEEFSTPEKFTDYAMEKLMFELSDVYPEADMNDALKIVKLMARDLVLKYDKVEYMYTVRIMEVTFRLVQLKALQSGLHLVM